jgi:Uma2 family endonuclease
MLVEIVSPESVDRDWKEKPAEYEAAGVPEYWIVDPLSQHAQVQVLSEAGKYEIVPERDGWLVSVAIPGFRLKTKWYWPATRPKVADALREIAPHREPS